MTPNEGQYFIQLMKLTKNSKIWQHGAYTSIMSETPRELAKCSDSWDPTLKFLSQNLWGLYLGIC